MLAGSYFATEASYSHMYTDSASSGRSRVHHSSMFALGMRAIPLSFHRRHIVSPSFSAAAAFVPSLYHVGSAPPAHQPKTLISPQVNVQPAHQQVSAIPSSHSGSTSLPVPDVSTLVPKMYRVPPMTYTGAANNPMWGPNGSSSRSPAVAATTSQVVDPNAQLNHVGYVPTPAPFSAAYMHKFLPPPSATKAHQVIPSLPSNGSQLAVPGSSGSHPPVAPEYSSSSHTHHTMFFARVLVGRSAVGRSDYRTPPPLNPSDQFGRCFDSCINRPISPSIFVIFNSAQSYPEYIIEYVNKSKSADPV